MVMQRSIYNAHTSNVSICISICVHHLFAHLSQCLLKEENQFSIFNKLWLDNRWDIQLNIDETAYLLSSLPCSKELVVEHRVENHGDRCTTESQTSTQ